MDTHDWNPTIYPRPDPLWRESGPDRRILNANDWYGRGVLFGITGEGHTKEMRQRVYCGKGAAFEQFMMGARDARSGGMT